MSDRYAALSQNTLIEEVELRDGIIRDLQIENQRLGNINTELRTALEEIASDLDPKQTWTYVAVERRLIARRALDKLQEMTS